MTTEIGMKINNLTIIEDMGIKNKRRIYKVRCDCGKEEIVLRQCLFSKNRPQKSCRECFSKRIKEINKKHGKNNTRLYHIWENMNQRCNNPKAPSYKDYGGRGINICAEWRDYTVFERWALNNGYKDDLTIDRVNNNEGYNPSNCQWVNRKVQANNTRQNVLITYKGEIKTLA